MSAKWSFVLVMWVACMLSLIFLYQMRLKLDKLQADKIRLELAIKQLKSEGY